MKPLSVEMACLLGIQNEIQAVCNGIDKKVSYLKLKKIKCNSRKVLIPLLNAMYNVCKVDNFQDWNFRLHIKS